MEMKIMISAALLLGGFLWTYLFIRQLLFNFRIASPTIEKMNALQKDLIVVGAVRYTRISNITNFLVPAVILALVIYFSPLYMIISFGVGAIAAFFFLIFRIKPENKEMFDLFAIAYYRFIPDDELRTIVYNKEYKKVYPRLKAMGIHGTFVPKFEKDSQ